MTSTPPSAMTTELNEALKRAAENARLYSDERAKSQRLQFELDDRNQEIEELKKSVLELQNAMIDRGRVFDQLKLSAQDTPR